MSFKLHPGAQFENRIGIKSSSGKKII